MIRNTYWMLVCLLLLAAPAFPLAMAIEPGQPLQTTNWPEGLEETITSRTWAGAYWCNGFDYFYYTGDAAAFNKFLEQFAKVKHADLILQVSPGPGYGVSLEGKHTPADWSVSWSEWSHYPQTAADIDLHGRRVTLEVWITGHVDLSNVIVPKIIQIQNPQKVQIGPKDKCDQSKDPASSSP